MEKFKSKDAIETMEILLVSNEKETCSSMKATNLTSLSLTEMRQKFNTENQGKRPFIRTLQVLEQALKTGFKHYYKGPGFNCIKIWSNLFQGITENSREISCLLVEGHN